MSFAWAALPVNDGEEMLLEQREGHSSCVLKGGDGEQYLVVLGGFSANCDGSDIIGVPLRAALGAAERVSTIPPPLRIGSCGVVARDGGVLHSLPGSMMGIGFGGIDLDSYDQVNTCYSVRLVPNVGGGDTDATVMAEVYSLPTVNSPPPRCRAASSMVFIGDCMPGECISVLAQRAPDGDGDEAEEGGDSSVVIPRGWAMIVFGGEGADGTVLDDLWLLQLCSADRTAEGEAPVGVLQWTCLGSGCASISPWPSARYLAALPQRVVLSEGVDVMRAVMYGGAHYAASSDGAHQNAVISNSEVWGLAVSLRGSVPPLRAIWERWDEESFGELIASKGKSAINLPRCNGHVGAAVFSLCEALRGSRRYCFFGGKDFSTGNDAIHVLSAVREQEGENAASSLEYERIACPFAEDAYVNVDEDVGGTGRGVWPHWRYTPTLDHVDTEDASFLLLTCGECRHNDVAPIYFMRL